MTEAGMAPKPAKKSRQWTELPRENGLLLPEQSSHMVLKGITERLHEQDPNRKVPDIEFMFHLCMMTLADYPNGPRAMYALVKIGSRPFVVVLHPKARPIFHLVTNPGTISEVAASYGDGTLAKNYRTLDSINILSKVVDDADIRLNRKSLHDLKKGVYWGWMMNEVSKTSEQAVSALPPDLKRKFPANHDAKSAKRIASGVGDKGQGLKSEDLVPDIPVSGG